jgi:MFS family permease
MRVIHENHQGFSTILAFALIPLSGFATDIYIPSLPSMAADLKVSTSAVQFSLVLFMISSGITQIFIGSILDSFGRFRIGQSALAVFSIASFVIATVPDIHVIYAMRVVQGVAVSLIVVGKRAYFVDVYSGEKLKHYTSMFSIIWATAPILAPFAGGYLQNAFGWQSNFYFLGIFGLIFLLLETIYSGETLKNYHPFNSKSVIKVYGGMMKTGDFISGVLILGLCYALLVIYGMASPFIIEHVFNFSPVITGYSSLLSGFSVMLGGIISKSLIGQPLTKKIKSASATQVLLAVLMIVTGAFFSNIYTLVAFTVAIHICSGFIFNSIYSYCIGRFSHNAGTATGLIGAGIYMGSSIFSYGVVNVIPIKTQTLLGAANLIFIVAVVVLFTIFDRHRAALKKAELMKEKVAA